MTARSARAVLVGPRIQSPTEFAHLLELAGGLGARDVRIGVDGGTSAWLRSGIEPDFAVGDWDSLRRGDRVALRRFKHITLPTQKERSDLFYAATAAVSSGSNEILCLGLSGGRLDHELATLYDLASIAREGAVRISVLALDRRIDLVSPRSAPWRARLKRGQCISVLPLGGEARGVTLRGFRYSMKGGVLDCSSQGLSNEVKDGPVEVQVRRGVLAVYMPL